LKQRASEHLGREVLHAVISVPAFFDDAMRGSVCDAMLVILDDLG
jgi:molecular chaperone DnaK (HSP70)